MNCLMGGMIVMATAFAGNPDAHDPTRLFWFHMSMSLMVGFVVAYPMNWWLVANHLKHGMMTVRRPGDPYAPRRRHGDARHGDGRRRHRHGDESPPTRRAHGFR